MIALFGGTFDPVHYGHLRAATEAREKLGLEALTLLPAGNPPHRQGTYADASHRLKMLQLAVHDVPSLQVDDREVRRPGHSYMVDTLAEFRAENGDEKPLALLLGQDAVNQLDSWKNWRQLFDLAHIIIMRRPESGHKYSGKLFAEIQCRLTSRRSDLQQPSGCVLPLEVTQLAISSTGIRELLQQGRSCDFLMPPNVIGYVCDNGLYGSRKI